jgi:GDP-L-fucose synthase
VDRIDPVVASVLQSFNVGVDHYSGKLRSVNRCLPTELFLCFGSVTIMELATIVAETVGYQGEIEWDTSKPDGTPRKLLDVSRLTKSGWTAAIDLKVGIRSTVEWYRDNLASLRN